MALTTFTQTWTELQKTRHWVTAHYSLGVRLSSPCVYVILVPSHDTYEMISISEWGLPTQFNASDAFLNKWADAQKLAYSQGAGWIVSL
jgi:hypothetical protein